MESLRGSCTWASTTCMRKNNRLVTIYFRESCLKHSKTRLSSFIMKLIAGLMPQRSQNQGDYGKKGSIKWRLTKKKYLKEEIALINFHSTKDSIQRSLLKRTRRRSRQLINLRTRQGQTLNRKRWYIIKMMNKAVWTSEEIDNNVLVEPQWNTFELPIIFWKNTNN